MSPMTFAILALAGLIVVSHLVQLVFELTDAEPAPRKSDRRLPSQIA